MTVFMCDAKMNELKSLPLMLFEYVYNLSQH